MYWEEHIDILKKRFLQSDFQDHYTDWPTILRSIESKFIVKRDSNYHFTNWIDNIKNQSLIRTIPRDKIKAELDKLNSTTNYWLVVTGNTPTSKLLVYDCKLTPMNAIISLTKDHFFIIDKKYKWLVFFQADNDQVSLIKSANGETPFDK
jgi:hypothetical protein